MIRGKVYIYVRVPLGADVGNDARDALEAQAILGRKAAKKAKATILAEYGDVSDGVEVGPALRSLLDHAGAHTRGGGKPFTVVVDRLVRISKVIDEVRAVANRIHVLNGELYSLGEPDAAFASNPHWPVSRGNCGPIVSPKTIAAARFFGALVASHIRADDPIHFAALRQALRGGSLTARSAIAKVSPQSHRIPSPSAGLHLLELLSDGEADTEQLEAAFGSGLIGELQLHNDLMAPESPLVRPNWPAGTLPTPPEGLPF